MSVFLRMSECVLMRVNRGGKTAIHYAAEHNQTTCIDALVKMKVDVNVQDK